MKKQTKYIIIYILMVLVLSMTAHIVTLYISQPTVTALWKPCVPNEESAIKIAQIICKAYWDIEIEEEAFIAVCGKYNFNFEWQVRLKKEYDFNKKIDENYIVSDDSGIFINAQDGTISRVMIYKDDIDSYYELKRLYQRNGWRILGNEK